MKTLIAAAAMALLLCAPARAAPDDAKERTAILAQLDRFFVAMSAHDPKTWSEIFVEGSLARSQNLGPDGKATLRLGSIGDMVAHLAGGPDMQEGVWTPTVLIRGPMAVVWAPYEFKLAGKSHHCGIDVFDFLKVDGVWKMSNAMWTSEPAACAELKAAH